LHRRTRLAALAISTILAHPSYAQDQLEQLDDRFEEARPVLSAPGTVLPRFDPVSPPPAATGITFRLNRVLVEGNSAISVDVIDDAYASLIGSEVSVAQIFGIANEITRIYGDEGYPLSRAIIPAQEIDGRGILRVAIVEGFADTVVVSGPAEGNSTVAAYAASIADERPLTSATLERYLLLGDDLPGLEVSSVLQRSETTPNATDILLTSRATDPTSFSLSLDNFGTEAVGPYQLGFSGTIENLLHQNSATSVRLVVAHPTEELAYGSIEHSFVVGTEGTEISLGGRYSTSEPGTGALTAIDLSSESHTWFIGIDHPFIRSRNRNLIGYATLEARDSETDSIAGLLTQDRIRSLRVGVNYDTALDSGAIFTAAAEVSIGLTGLGANENSNTLNSRDDGRVDYRKLTVDLSYRHPLEGFLGGDAPWTLALASTGQLTNDPLLASEECAFGGGQYGRGFDPSTISGDKCVGLDVELSRAIDAGEALDNLRVYGFADYGAVRNLDSGATSDWASIASAGFGADFGFTDALSGSLEVGVPLRDTTVVSLDTTPRATFSLSWEF
jgi:hemolysin activation/secretion protein